MQFNKWKWHLGERLLKYSLPLKQKSGRKSVNLHLQFWRQNLIVTIRLIKDSSLNCRDIVALFQANCEIWTSLNVWNKKRARSEKVLQNSLFRVVCIVQNHHSWVLKRVKEKFNHFLQRHMNSIRNPLAFQSCQDNFPYRLFLHYKYVTVCSPDQRFNRLMAFKTPLSYLTRYPA